MPGPAGTRKWPATRRRTRSPAPRPPPRRAPARATARPAAPETTGTRSSSCRQLAPHFGDPAPLDNEQSARATEAAYVVRDQDQGAVSRQPLDRGFQFRGADLVKVRSRLVKQYQRRVLDKDPRQRELVTLSG